MRSQITLSLVPCLLGCFAIQCVAQEKPDVATIRVLEQKWTDAYKARQVDVLSSLLAEDYLITLEDGTTYGKVGFVSLTAQPSERVEIAELSEIKIRMHGDTAVVTGAYHERGESSGKPYDYHEKLTDVWMKISGKWLLVASHYSVPAS